MALPLAALGISEGRFGNVLTNLRRAIERLHGTGAWRLPPVTQLSPAWAALYQAMAPNADSCGVAPDAVSDAIVDDWVAWRSTSTQALWPRIRPGRGKGRRSLAPGPPCRGRLAATEPYHRPRPAGPG